MYKEAFKFLNFKESHIIKRSPWFWAPEQYNVEEKIGVMNFPTKYPKNVKGMKGIVEY